MNSTIRRCAFVTGSILLMLSSAFSGDSFVRGEETDPITTIHVVTPAWVNQTHEDGTGLFFEILRKVYEPVGITMQFEIVPWKRAKMMIDTNQADARLAIVRTGSEQLMPQYPLYVDYTVAIFKKENIREWKGIKTLDGKHAVWMRGYNYQNNFPFRNITLKWGEINNPDQAWQMLEKDRTDVYIDALIDVKPYIKQHNIDMTPYRLEILYRRNAYVEFAHSQRSEKLIEIYDRRILELLNSGELENMFEKWGVPFTPFLPKDGE